MRNSKRATCFATLRQNELNNDVARFTTRIKPVLQQIRLLAGLMWVVKRATSLFNSFCSNVAKQVARFCCPFFRTLTSLTVEAVILATLVRRGDIFTHLS